VEKSLLYRELPDAREAGDEGEPRFTMLETIREFGQETLAATGNEHPLRYRHARYFRD